MAHIPNRDIDFTATLYGTYEGDSGVQTISPAGLGDNDEIVYVSVYSIGGPAITKVASMPFSGANVEGSGVAGGLIAISGNTFSVATDANIGATVYVPATLYYYVVHAQLS